MLYNIIGADGLTAPANKDWIYLICMTLTCHAIFAKKKQVTEAGRLAALTRRIGFTSLTFKTNTPCNFHIKTGDGLTALAKKLYKNRS